MLLYGPPLTGKPVAICWAGTGVNQELTWSPVELY